MTNNFKINQMKNRIGSLGLILLIGAMIFSACKKDDSTNGTPSTTGSVTSGTWRVSLYQEPGEDHTDDFNGYIFTFNTDGAVIATISGISTTGTWSIDDSENEIHIELGNNAPLDKLSKGWLIISITDSEMILKDDNPSKDEELHFTKS
jgi:hypothetical protein